MNTRNHQAQNFEGKISRTESVKICKLYFKHTKNEKTIGRELKNFENVITIGNFIVFMESLKNRTKMESDILFVWKFTNQALL
jgi:hypothetical protein